MVNVIKFAFEAFFGIIFITMALSAVTYITTGDVFANLSSLAGVMILFIDVIIIAIYLYALAKNAGVISGK